MFNISRVGSDRTRPGGVQKVTGRGESGRIMWCLKSRGRVGSDLNIMYQVSHGSGRVGSGQEVFKISRVGSGQGQNISFIWWVGSGRIALQNSGCYNGVSSSVQESSSKEKLSPISQVLSHTWCCVPGIIHLGVRLYFYFFAC